MRFIICAAMATLATTAQAFQLSCTRQGGLQTVTVNGKTETRRQDYQSTIAVDVDLAARTLTMEGNVFVGGVTSVTGAEIVAGETSVIAGTARRATIRVNRITGELSWDSQFTGPTNQSFSNSTYKCERAKAKF
jgi:hypothetical protein